MAQKKNVEKTADAKVKTMAKKVKRTAATTGTAGTAATGRTGPSPVFSVQGTVTSPDRAGVGGLSVTVVDKNVGEDTVLGTATTDERGSYSVRFSLPARSRKIQTRPDLQACVYSGKTLIASSDVRYNAGQSETLDVWLPEGIVQLQSEYETLTSKVAVHYSGNLGDLKENDTRQDITYLANKTGWDARAVALAALADQFSRHIATDDTSTSGSTIHPALYYSLFRAGLSPNPDTLYRIDAGSIKKTWEQAVSRGIIPAALQETLPHAIETFTALSARKILTAPPFAGTSAMKDMLAVSGLSDAGSQKKYAELYVQHRTDMIQFWDAIAAAFPKESLRLKTDAKLGYLTINNAGLVTALHDAVGRSGLTRGKSGVSDVVDLAHEGYHSPGKWEELLKKNEKIAVPKEIPGDTADTRRANYSKFLAAQVRLSYPTASVAEMVGSKYLDLKAGAGISDRVSAFLKEHHDSFDISGQPVEQYIRRGKIEVDGGVVTQVKRLQRVYQITASDQSMAVLLDAGIDSAYSVVRYQKEQFVNTFAKKMGSERTAAQVYERSAQLHACVLNIAMSYLTAKNAIALGGQPTGSTGTGHFIIPDPQGLANLLNCDVPAYATLETLFGSMDYCTCEHCRSILSPAAYLVDLLHFLDANPGDPQYSNPQAELFRRRPDIRHLPLTCANTNVALPYIDIVNEVLEYFVANSARPGAPSNPVDGYIGYDTGTTCSEDLLANPQFSNTTAYDILRVSDTVTNDSAKLYFPPPLPFHQPLETMRKYFTRFEVPLQKAMEVLLVDDVLDPADTSAYGWRAVLLEDAQISPPEYRSFTDYTSVPLMRMYGFIPGTPENTMIAELSGVKKYSRRIGITYDDIVAILKTKFINPESDLIPKLERLGVSLATLDALYKGAITDATFNALLPTGAGAIDITEYNGNPGDTNYAPVIRNWLKAKDSTNTEYFTRISRLIVLMDPDANPENPPVFNNFEFRYAIFNTSGRISTVDFVRLLRFIRLWKKTGWTIEQTDAALSALYPADKLPGNGTAAENLKLLDEGFAAFLPRLGVLMRVMNELDLTAKKHLLSLLACWSPINTYGTLPLYRQLLLNPSILKQDIVFSDNGYGEYLSDPAQKLVGHKEALRAAFSLTEKEYLAIADALGFGTDTVAVPYTQAQPQLDKAILAAAPGISYDGSSLIYTGFLSKETRDAVKNVPGVSAQFKSAVDALYLKNQQDLTPLSLENISRIYRRGYLARALKLSVPEFLALIALPGLNPFSDTDPAKPGILRLAALVRALKDLSVKPNAALYLVWNTNLSGKPVPDSDMIQSLAHNLRSALAAVDTEFGARGTLTAEEARAKMVRAYGTDITDLFFSLLENTLETRRPYSRTVPVSYLTSVPYQHGQPALEQAIADAGAGALAYDNTQQRLSYNGILESSLVDALRAAASSVLPIPQDIDSFNAAIGALYTKNQEIIRAGLEQPFVDAALPGSIAYNNFAKELTCCGDLTLSRRDALKAAASSVLAATPGEVTAFNTAADALCSGCQEVVAPFLALYPALGQLYAAYASPANTDPVEKKRADLLASLLEDLRVQSKRQQALQVICAATKSDTALANAILNDADVLASVDDPALPALEDLIAAERPGLSLQYFMSDTVPDPLPPKTNANYRRQEADLDYGPGAPATLPANPAPGQAISGIWSGYLEPRKNGFYNIRIETDPGATVGVELGDGTVVLGQAGTVWSNTSPLELRAGALYPVKITVQKVKSAMKISWTTAGQGWEVIPRESLYPEYSVGQLRSMSIRFLKVASLASALRLTVRETVHFATDSDCLIGGKSWFISLPVSGNPDSVVSAALLKNFITLLDYTAIKRILSPEDETLLDVIEDPGAVTQDGVSLLSMLTQWDTGSLDNLLIRFKKTGADGKPDYQSLMHFATFLRVYRAFSLVNTIGVPAGALIAAATDNPDSGTVTGFQAALRARYPSADWRDIIQPINNELRGLSRDALVAYILQWRLSCTDSTLKMIDTPEKLFEYFLMDVEMEPCMQTSRVRHALSSVQLFIERSLLNLEPSVSTSFMDEDRRRQWQWMKRYRVWEANRKVFLYPENWLEPELRDQQSPFFREAMNELLQGDITEDAAATALLNYLSRLNDVAKLEVCSMYHVDGDSGKNTPDIDHVIARTAGSNRKYYYRKCESGCWSPWEQVKLEIEDNPVLPVVWNGRLLLFWLRLVNASPAAQPVTETTETDKQAIIADIAMKNMNQTKIASKLTITAILCWSEYFNGKWQETRTSDTSSPLIIDEVAADAFNRSSLSLHSSQAGDELRIIISGSSYSPYFSLHNTHCVTSAFSTGGTFDTSQGAAVASSMLVIMDSKRAQYPVAVLANVSPTYASVVKPYQNILDDPPYSPFFLQDKRYATYVHIDKEQVRLPWVTVVPGTEVGPVTVYKPHLPDLYVEPLIPIPRPGPEYEGVIVENPVVSPPDRSIIERFVESSENIRVGVNTMGSVAYSDTAAVTPEAAKTAIGPSGRIKSMARKDYGANTPGGGING